MSMVWSALAAFSIIFSLQGAVSYNSARSRIQAVDKDTGGVVWSSRKLSGAAVEILVVRDMLIVRTKKNAVYGLETGGGVVLWKYEKAKGRLTNMILAADGRTLIFADRGSVIGLDVESEGEI